MAEDIMPNIDKLTCENWPIWKMQIRNYLIVKRLWRLCEGHAAAPVRNIGEDVPSFLDRQEDYSVNNARVMSILCQTISTQVLSLFVSHNVTTPHDAWTVLLSHFELGVESGTLNASSADGEASTGSIPTVCRPTNRCENGQSLGGDGSSMRENDVDSDNVEIFTANGANAESDNRQQGVISYDATRHTVKHNLLYDYHMSIPKSVCVADVSVCTSLCIGNSILYVCVCGSNSVLYVLNDVMCVPSLSHMYDVAGSQRLTYAVKKFVEIVNSDAVSCDLLNDEASEEEGCLSEAMECKRSGSIGRRAPFLDVDRFGDG